MKQISSHNLIRLVLLLVLLVLAGICASVGVTYSRYINEKNRCFVYDEARYTWAFDSARVGTAGVAEAEVVKPEAGEETEAGAGKLEQLYYDKDSAVIKITYPENADSVVLFPEGNSFSAGTSYSTNGETGYILYSGGCVRISSVDTMLVMKFYNAGTDVLKAVFYSGQVALSETSLTLVCDETMIWQAEEAETAVLGIEDETGKGGSLSWQIPLCFANGSVSCEVYHVGTEGTELVDNEELLPVEITKGEQAVTVKVANPADNKAIAGTYKLKITQRITTDDGNEMELMSISKPFFVNYR